MNIETRYIIYKTALNFCYTDYRMSKYVSYSQFYNEIMEQLYDDRTYLECVLTAYSEQELPVFISIITMLIWYKDKTLISSYVL